MRSAKKRILVIEDEQDIAIYLETILLDNGYEVDIAVDGFEAMKKIKNKKPDLISLDISLPEKTGVKLYCELKENKRLSKIPVVMVTGIEKGFKKYINSGKGLPPPNGYISKPFNVDELLAVVSDILNKNNK